MAETFGKTDKGSTQLDLYPPNIYACLYQSGSAGTLASLSVYIKTSVTCYGCIKCAIYDSNRNFLANGATEELDCEAGYDNFKTFNFLTPPSVAASTNYYLAVWNSWNQFGYYSDGDPAQLIWKDYTYDGWPATIEIGSSWAGAFSIYATYEEAPPPAAKTLVQAALISIAPLIVLPTLGQILKVTGSC